jgi:hypothetical protein
VAFGSEVIVKKGVDGSEFLHAPVPLLRQSRQSRSVMSMRVLMQSTHVDFAAGEAKSFPSLDPLSAPP